MRRIAIWTPGRAAARDGARRPHRRRSSRSRFRRTARRSPRRPGTTPCGSGRSPAARRACSKAITQNVNGVAFTPDGRALVSAGYDATLRIWPLDGGAPTVVTLPTPLNAVAVAPDGEIVAGGADGKVYFLSPHGRAARRDRGRRRRRSSRSRSRRDGTLVAAAGIRGSVAIIDRATRKLARTLVGPGLPVWSVAFFPDSRTLLTGGTDRMIRRWDAVTGEPHRRGGRWARRTIRSRPMPAIPAPRCSAPASPATR